MGVSDIGVLIVVTRINWHWVLNFEVLLLLGLQLYNCRVLTVYWVNELTLSSLNYITLVIYHLVQLTQLTQLDLILSLVILFHNFGSCVTDFFGRYEKIEIVKIRKIDAINLVYKCPLLTLKVTGVSTVSSEHQWDRQRFRLF
jgi:hypothetical protein